MRFRRERAVPIVAGEHLSVRVNCLANAGRILDPIKFAPCVSPEVAEGVAAPLMNRRKRVLQP